jgi:peptidoglycan LD-endopeptidase CwlK
MADPVADVMAGIHPALRSKISQVLQAMAVLGYPMKVVQGVRSAAQQQALYAQGRTLPGPKVTNCDGTVTRSNHQVHPADGYGHAVDCAFLVGDPFGETQPWPLYGAAVKAVGLIWGGSWTSFQDRPHAELA